MRRRGEATTRPAADEAGAVILEVEGVAKLYGSVEDGVEAIGDFSCHVRGGEFLSIVGPSGCGKTTLLKLIAGLIEPTAGTVRLDGHPTDGPGRDFGMVFQTPVLLPWRSALDNVLLPIEILGRPKRAYRDRALALLEQVGLEGFAHRRPAELSGGMQQRVALCRALIHDPRILLMDEPFASVDEMTRERLNDHLLDLWGASGKTIVFVTHNIHEAAYLSDRVLVMTGRPGRLAGTESIDLPRPRVGDVRFETSLMGHAKNIQTLLRRPD